MLPPSPFLLLPRLSAFFAGCILFTFEPLQICYHCLCFLLLVYLSFATILFFLLDTFFCWNQQFFLLELVFLLATTPSTNGDRDELSLKGCNWRPILLEPTSQFCCIGVIFCDNRLIVLLHGDGSVQRWCPAKIQRGPMLRGPRADGASNQRHARPWRAA